MMVPPPSQAAQSPSAHPPWAPRCRCCVAAGPARRAPGSRGGDGAAALCSTSSSCTASQSPAAWTPAALTTSQGSRRRVRRDCDGRARARRRQAARAQDQRSAAAPAARPTPPPPYTPHPPPPAPGNPLPRVVHQTLAAGAGLHASGRVIIVGDPHSCAAELAALLAAVAFRRGVDNLICTGDLVTKGPEPEAVSCCCLASAWVRAASRATCRAPCSTQNTQCKPKSTARTLPAAAAAPTGPGRRA